MIAPEVSALPPKEVKKKPIHFSGLNGLRAIAALAVLFAHATQGLDEFGLDSYIFGRYPDGTPRATLLAGFGVSIFFALSGFLITYLLLEEQKSGEINVKNFYVRRVLRIWPLYYVYLTLTIITLLIYGIPFQSSSVFYYVFLLANIPFIFGGVLPFLAHFWSLGVEEQFYSFWPWMVRKGRSLLGVTIAACVVLLVLKFAFRWMDYHFHNDVMGWPYVAIHVTRFHCMLIGAIGAILFFQRNALFLRLMNNWLTQGASWLVIVLACINKFHVLSFLDNEIMSVVTTCLIIGQIGKRYRIINLAAAPFEYIGRISYGIYVIHPLVIFYLSKLVSFAEGSGVHAYLLTYATVFLATIVIAHFSYRYLELPFLRLKAKFSPRHMESRPG